MAKLRAAECREFIKAVVEKAEVMRVPVSIAVVGAEGHLIAVERMDEAGFITPDTAIAKAFTVAAFRSMSPRFPDGLVIKAVVQGAQSAIARQLGRYDQWADCRKRRVRAYLQGRRNGWSLWNFRRDFATGRGDSDLCARQGPLGSCA
jgi:hypothetical protein